MAILKNQKHEKFAQLVAQGESAVSAYRKAYKASQRTAEGNASALMENHGVKGRIQELQSKAERATVLTIEEKRAYLREIVLAQGPEKIQGTRIHQGYDRGGNPTMPDKLRALELDAKLAGEFKERIEHDVTDALANVMKSIRGKRDSATE